MSTRKSTIRTRNDLVVYGTGIIALGLWSVVKTVMFVIVRADDLLAQADDETIPAWITLAIIAAVTAIIIAISLTLRVYVGRSAIAEGKGAKKGGAYLVFAGILAAVNLAGMVMNAASFADPGTGILETAAVLIVDVTVVFTFIGTIVSAVRLRKAAGTKGGEKACS